MKRTELRSDCPINFSLETFGDTWSLLIMRDIICFGRKTFNEFLASDEKIARNILADRLERLQSKGLLVKKTHPEDRRKEIYSPTERGLDIIPILLDLSEWGSSHGPATAPSEWLEIIRTRRTEAIACVRDTVRAGGSIFVGENTAYEKMTKLK